MSEALQRVITDEERLCSALAISQPNDLDTTLLNDTSFLKIIRGITRAKAIAALHGKGVERLIEIAQTGKSREALAAILMLGRITGDLKINHNVEVKVSFEDLRQRASNGNNNPLSNLFDIRNDVIEADIDEGGDDADDG